MSESKSLEKRINIPFFEGVNSLVGFNIGKKTEFYHAENARSKEIGTIEKREGQTVLGTDTNGNVFITTANYCLFPFTSAVGKGLYRISETATLSPSASVSPSASTSPSLSTSPSSSISSSVSPSVSPSSSASGSPSSSQSPSGSVSPSASISASISPSASYSPSASVSPSGSVSPSSSPSTSPSSNLSTIYYLSSVDKWTPLSGYGAGISGGIFDYTYAEGSCFLANYNDTNRYIKADGVTVVDSTNATGHLFNSPQASRINFYKDRLYVADFYSEGERYKTTILRSSYPMGIISLISGDQATISTGATIDLTDTKYFYTDSGANTYDIYRGGTLIKTITVTTINETSVVATWTGGAMSLLSSDEVWISGTYSGAKRYRWSQNPTTMGEDVKRYDSFKLSGGENDSITMMTNIGNVMMISNKNAMSSWNDYTLENFDLDIGNVSKKGYVKILGTLYFMHYTGVYATSGGIPRLMSNKIEKYITGATKAGLEACAAGKKGRSIFFTIGDVTLYNTDGSTQKTLSDVCLEYNLTQENWFVHTNVKASEFTTFVESSDSNKLEFIDTDGYKSVKEFLSGETDDGTEINFRIDTIKLTPMPTTFDYHIKPVTLLIDTERGASLQAYVNLDKKEKFYPLEGKIVKGLSVIKVNNKDEDRGTPPVCRLISISLRDTSKQICKLSRMTLTYLPTAERDSDNEK